MSDEKSRRASFATILQNPAVKKMAEQGLLERAFNDALFPRMLFNPIKLWDEHRQLEDLRRVHWVPGPVDAHPAIGACGAPFGWAAGLHDLRDGLPSELTCEDCMTEYAAWRLRQDGTGERLWKCDAMGCDYVYIGEQVGTPQCPHHGAGAMRRLAGMGG